MGTIIYGEEGINPYVKRYAGKTGVEYSVAVNENMTKEEFVEFLSQLIKGLDI